MNQSINEPGKQLFDKHKEGHASLFRRKGRGGGINMTSLVGSDTYSTNTPFSPENLV
jgi:hypothetical protein